MMDLQKEPFIKPAESFPYKLKITLWKDLGRLVQKHRIAIYKTFFLICCQTLLCILDFRF